MIVGAPRLTRHLVLVAFMCLALLTYLVLLSRIAVAMIGSGSAVGIGLGTALLLTAGIGCWAMIATLRDGFAQQRLARQIAGDGLELDVSTLPRRPSGRIDRDAADALFVAVRAEVDGDPHDWRRWYRLARAYEYAGDRRRFRQAMKTAVRLRERR